MDLESSLDQGSKVSIPVHEYTGTPSSSTRRGRGSLAERPASPLGEPALRDIEMSYIQAVLEKHNGNKPAASKELGISLKTLYNKINQLQRN